MKKLFWLLAITVAVAGLSYALGVIYLSRYPNSDTAISYGTYSTVLETSQQKDQKVLMVFTVVGALYGSLLGAIKIKDSRVG